jgi:hypothetical protein
MIYIPDDMPNDVIISEETIGDADVAVCEDSDGFEYVLITFE